MTPLLQPYRVRSWLVAFAVFSAAPAAAMDCAKAKSPVEKTICSDTLLKALDENLSRFYFAALKTLLAKGDKAGHDEVQTAQRAWVAARDACAFKSAREIKSCVEESTSRRLGEIQTPRFGLDVVPPTGLTVGTELLAWERTDDGRRTLNHRGRVVLEEPYAGRTSPPFTIHDHWKSSETDAVLIEAGEAATADCSEFFVVESRRPGEISVNELGDVCVGLEGPEVKRNGEGFAYSSPASPSEGAEIKQWRARTGEVTNGKIAFRPEPGSTMQGLASAARPEAIEPLRNAEFFAATMRLGTADKARVLEALWQVGNGCDTCNSENSELYGVFVDAKTVSYSGCGWFMHGSLLSCGKSDALAVWDREGGGFYFATDEHRNDGRHGEKAHVDPPLATWPALARARYETWRVGGAWEKNAAR